MLYLGIQPFLKTENVSLSDLSAVNFIGGHVGLLVKKATMSGLLMSHREKMSFM